MNNLLNKLRCILFGHYVKKAKVKPGAYFDHEWTITCGRCGVKASYFSPFIRLYGKEQMMGWKQK